MIALIGACVALALAVIAVVLWPLLRGAGVPPARQEFDLAVYRDQLRELDRDVARGLLGEAEAQTARLEIQRRMLAEAPMEAPVAAARPSLPLAAVLGVLMAAGAGGLYLVLGAPGIPDEPAATRTDVAKGGGKASHVDFARAAAELEAKLQADPNNVQGWLLYARTVSSLSQWNKAINAYEHVMKLEPNQPDIMAAYGEMLVMAADGIVTPKAHDVFVEAGRLDPKETVSRFYLALGDLQAGETRTAIAKWQKLAADLPASSDMRDEVVRRITQSASDAGLTAPVIPPPAPEPAPAAAAGAPPASGPNTSGPNAEQMAAAANMTPEQRKAMISGMVAQLAQKLKDKPDDADGWLRLGRAYMVLAETDKAEDAFNHAAQLRPGDVSVQLQEVQALLDSRTENAPVPQRAITLLRQVEQANPKQPEALWLLGVAAAQADDKAKAASYWQRLLAVLPPDGEDAKMVKGALDGLKAK